MDFTVPCGLFFGAFFLGVAAASWYFKYRYIDPLEWRIKRLERILQPRHTTGGAPRTSKSRYVPIEQHSHVHYVKE